jgi:hypothetical protein
LPEYATALVVDRGKILVPFERDRLFLSIHFACSHRDDAQIAATSVTATVLGVIARKKLAPEGMLSNQIVARLTYDTLRRFDRNAAATYRAHHQAAL